MGPDGPWFAFLHSLFPGRGGVDVQRAWGPRSVPGLYLKHYLGLSYWCHSVTQSCPTLCDPVGLQNARLPCSSPTPGTCSHSCPLSQWCHATISSSVVPFSSCLHSFPASGPFLMSLAPHIRWPKCWSFNFSISPSNEYSGLTSFRTDSFDNLIIGLIFLI